MEIRIILKNLIYPFKDIKEAVKFRDKNGGIIYVRECSCIYGKH
jgi:hypothetical protein